MAFSGADRRVLLAVRGVGPTVLLRLEQIGVDSPAALARREADAICAEVAALLGGTCWRNAPQARAAIAGAVAAARAAVPTAPRRAPPPPR